MGSWFHHSFNGEGVWGSIDLSSLCFFYLGAGSNQSYKRPELKPQSRGRERSEDELLWETAHLGPLVLARTFASANFRWRARFSTKRSIGSVWAPGKYPAPPPQSENVLTAVSAPTRLNRFLIAMWATTPTNPFPLPLESVAPSIACASSPSRCCKVAFLCTQSFSAPFFCP